MHKSDMFMVLVVYNAKFTRFDVLTGIYCIFNGGCIFDVQNFSRMFSESLWVADLGWQDYGDANRNTLQTTAEYNLKQVALKQNRKVNFEIIALFLLKANVWRTILGRGWIHINTLILIHIDLML